jgi:SAM-dependent methyltransferase
MTLDEAVRYLRARPDYAGLVRDAYLGADVLDSAARFEASGEFSEVKRLLEGRIDGATVLDLGAGTGIASRAFAEQGARQVYALEPDPSDEVGQGAIHRLAREWPIEIIPSYGEEIPVDDGSVDVVYARQVLHHTRDLGAVLRECARVLRPGGVFLACREHVVDDQRQLEAFLRQHPVHQLAGGEGAYSIPEYLGAIQGAGLVRCSIIGPWDSVINAFPEVRSQQELREFPRRLLEKRLSWLGRAIHRLPGVERLVWRRLKRSRPGRMYTFLAYKP